MRLKGPRVKRATSAPKAASRTTSSAAQPAPEQSDGVSAAGKGDARAKRSSAASSAGKKRLKATSGAGKKNSSSASTAVAAAAAAAAAAASIPGANDDNDWHDIDGSDKEGDNGKADGNEKPVFRDPVYDWDAVSPKSTLPPAAEKSALPRRVSDGPKTARRKDAAKDKRMRSL